jgi:hypothetical protein
VYYYFVEHTFLSFISNYTNKYFKLLKVEFYFCCYNCKQNAMDITGKMLKISFTCLLH